ncbi:hypothetical protein RUM43_004554 [Polyplax serrata]|uniref:Uncharacterized protein n=1 Tax=Polyplax serrata TaxID=468196 RepID=A0AAN8SCU5_POLSC
MNFELQFKKGGVEKIESLDVLLESEIRSFYNLKFALDMAQLDNPKSIALLFTGAFFVGIGVIAFLNVEMQSRSTHGELNLHYFVLERDSGISEKGVEIDLVVNVVPNNCFWGRTLRKGVHKLYVRKECSGRLKEKITMDVHPALFKVAIEAHFLRSLNRGKAVEAIKSDHFPERLFT